MLDRILPNIEVSIIHAYVRHLLGFYPTEAIRQRDADTFYFVYDTDDGIRLFVFYSEKNGDGEYDGIQTPVGYPILISKMLSHTDFAGIQAGDSAEKVRAIDPVMSVYEDMFFNVYKWNSIAAESYRKENNPIATIHYLRDGLLKIEYDIVDDNRLVVTNLIFDPNYDLTNLYGETYHYRILPQDLPER